MDVYADDKLVAKLTASLIEQGHKVFQIFMLDESLDGHITKLLDFYNPSKGMKILDVGCGIGEVSRLMKIKRPDLGFILINKSASQLALCPEEFQKIKTDFHNMYLYAPQADAIMINYALGHAKLDELMSEASRLLKGGGDLYLYDIASLENMYIDELDYRAYRLDEVIESASAAGFYPYRMIKTSKAYTKNFLKVLDEDTFNRLFKNVFPFMAKFVIHAH